MAFATAARLLPALTFAVVAVAFAGCLRAGGEPEPATVEDPAPVSDAAGPDTVQQPTILVFYMNGTAPPTAPSGEPQPAPAPPQPTPPASECLVGLLGVRLVCP